MSCGILLLGRSSTLPVIESPQVREMYPDYLVDDADRVFVRISNLSVHDHLRDLRTAHLNVMIRVSGVVTRRSGVFPQMKVVRYDCMKCGYVLGPFVQARRQQPFSFLQCCWSDAILFSFAQLHNKLPCAWFIRSRDMLSVVLSVVHSRAAYCLPCPELSVLLRSRQLISYDPVQIQTQSGEGEVRPNACPQCQSKGPFQVGRVHGFKGRTYGLFMSWSRSVATSVPPTSGGSLLAAAFPHLLPCLHSLEHLFPT